MFVAVVALISVLASRPSLARTDEAVKVSNVFLSGDGGFGVIRIPSVVVSKKGTVLAFAEGRQSIADQAKNKIILRRSSDHGDTWDGLQVVANAGDDSLNNPCAVVEQNTGRIFLMYQRIPAHLREGSSTIVTGYLGPNVVRGFLTWSDDDGKNWHEPVDVTRWTKRPVVATTICSGPGVGIQLSQGPHKGRLIMPFNAGPYGQWSNYAVFSDDRGSSWQWGADVPGALLKDKDGKTRSQVNEVQMVELSDGSVMLNSRQYGGAAARKVAVSKDGGETWSPIQDVPELRDPSCMGGILRYSFGSRHSQNVLIYTGPDSAQRAIGTVYISQDDGKSWPLKKVLVPGDFAYSVPTRLSDDSIGVLYETDDYKKIAFARFNLGWIVRD